MNSNSNNSNSAPRGKSADPVKVALDYALDEILDPKIKAAVLYHFGFKYRISINDKQPVLRDEVVYALQNFFGDGASLFMSKFDKKYFELTNTSPQRQVRLQKGTPITE